MTTQNVIESAYSTTPTATTISQWDANKNLSANNHIDAYTTTATAAGTTTLTVGSTYQQFFTGSTTQTVVMPVTSTLVLGQKFLIVNNSSGVVTVQSSGTNTIQAMAANTVLILDCILTSGTTAASWYANYNLQSLGSLGQGLSLSGSTLNIGGANNIAFNNGIGIQDSNGNLLLSFNATASAVNYFSILNEPTGQGPALSVTGSDSNVSMFLSTKGIGSFNFYSGSFGVPLLQIQAVASGVNYLTITGSATGSPSTVTLSSTGTDSNINLILSPKGTGLMKLSNGSSFSANASVATLLGSLGPTGSHTTVQTWLTIIDSGGTTRYIPCF